MNQTVNPALLEHSWTATVRLHNDLVISIWYTAWHSTKHCVKDIISISSDIPRHKIEPFKKTLTGQFWWG